VVTVGFTASTSGSACTPYATIYDRSTHQVIASNPNAQYCEPSGDCFSGRPTTYPCGSGWTLTINYLPESGQVAMFEYSGHHLYAFTSSYALTAQSFTQARVGTDFGSSPWDASYPAHAAREFREDRHLQPCGSDQLQRPRSDAVVLVGAPQAARQHWPAIRPRLGRRPHRPVQRRRQLPNLARVPQSAQGSAQPLLP
jgi:hypothetical protein